MKGCSSSWQCYVLTMLNRSGSNNRCTMGVMITVWEGRERGGRGGGGGRGECKDYMSNWLRLDFCLIRPSKELHFFFLFFGQQVGGDLHPEWLDWLPNEMNRSSNGVLKMDSLSLAIIWHWLQKWSCNPTGMDKWSPNLKRNSTSFFKWAPLIWSHLAEMEPIRMTKGSTSTPQKCKSSTSSKWAT